MNVWCRFATPAPYVRAKRARVVRTLFLQGARDGVANFIHAGSRLKTRNYVPFAINQKLREIPLNVSAIAKCFIVLFCKNVQSCTL